jgi:hypothetical protein
MLQRNRSTARLALFCLLALLSAACGITPEWSARKRTAEECPTGYLHYCSHRSSGTRCGCMPKQEMEAILRGQF